MSRAKVASKTLADGLTALFEQTAQRVADGVRSAATLEMQRAHGRWLLEQLGADTPLEDLDEEILDLLTAPGARRFGAETLRKRMSTIRAVLTLAARKRWIPRLPAFPQVIAPWRPRGLRLQRYEDAARIAEALQPHRRLWFWLALWTGQHASDVERMTWGDVDLGTERPSMMIRNTKNRKVAGLRVVVPRPLVGVLRAEFSRARPRPVDAIVRPWPSRKHTLPLVCYRLGLPPINAIDLRHTCASWMVRRLGITPAAVAWMGHSSPTMMARTYARALPAGLTEVSSELESMADVGGDRPST